MKPLRPRACDMHGRVREEPDALLPPFDVPAVLLVQYLAPHEGPQGAAADLSLYHLGVRGFISGGKLQGLGDKDTISLRP